MKERTIFSEKSAIVELIASGDLGEAIRETKELAQSQTCKLLKDLILLSFSFHDLENAIINDRIDYSVERKEKAKLASSLLAILDKLPAKLPQAA